MPKKPETECDLPYDEEDLESILEYASHLSNHTLREVIDFGEMDIGDGSKGYVGQVIEKGYFHIENNNLPVPDFCSVGMELKVVPIKSTRKGLVSKERLVLSIIDYNQVPEKGFNMFLDKNSHLLIVFYLWDKDQDIRDYRILKTAEWIPEENELRILRQDWETIEDFVNLGRAHLLSERLTMYLAASTKGAGHGSDLRTQPFSDVLAKQRALSLKSSFVTSLFNTLPDLNDANFTESNGNSVFSRPWAAGKDFRDFILDFFEEFIGLSCQEIELKLDIDLNENSKQYYHRLVMAMMGIIDGDSAVEFDRANIAVKTIRIKQNWRPKESMSFPAFKYEELVEQTWETSDFFEQIDREFLFQVFQFNTGSPQNEDRKDLRFLGAFFWSVPDNDLPIIEGVWNDTKEKILAEDFDDFVKSSDGRISHVRPHARNKKDTYPFRGKEHMKRSFWFNDQYIGQIVIDNLKK